ncbi:hypothetical protein J3459_008186 [Metarhizium acridum]|nr:hypothetical protein J3459_008186 [Metarhizium acridum]
MLPRYRVFCVSLVNNMPEIHQLDACGGKIRARLSSSPATCTHPAKSPRAPYAADISTETHPFWDSESQVLHLVGKHCDGIPWSVAAPWPRYGRYIVLPDVMLARRLHDLD